MKTQGIDISKVRITKKEQEKVEAALATLAKLGATPSKRVLHRIAMANRVRLDRDAIRRIEDKLTTDGHADVVLNRKRNIIVYSRETLAKKQEHGRRLGSKLLGKRGYLARLSPQERKELARKGGKAAAEKRSKKAAAKKARGLHWTQKPENRAKVLAATKAATDARYKKEPVAA
jgi:hypothetical protein